MKIKNFVIINCENIEEYLQEGFQPFGNPFVFGGVMAEIGKNEDGSSVYGQTPQVVGIAMVKYESITDLGGKGGGNGGGGGRDGSKS